MSGFKNVTGKISLPKLETLLISSSNLKCFNDLKSLKTICIIDNTANIENIDEIFDPSNIKELSIINPRIKFLNQFTNLRSLEIIGLKD